MMLDDESIHIAIRRPARLDRFILIRTNGLVKRRSKWTAPIQPWTWLDYTGRALLNDTTWLHPVLNGSQPDSPSPMGDYPDNVWLTDSHLVAEVQMHLSVTSCYWQLSCIIGSRWSHYLAADWRTSRCAAILLSEFNKGRWPCSYQRRRFLLPYILLDNRLFSAFACFQHLFHR